MKKTLFSIGVGAGLMYFLDPELGEVRRSMLRDRLNGIAPKTSAATTAAVTSDCTSDPQIAMM